MDMTSFGAASRVLFDRGPPQNHHILMTLHNTDQTVRVWDSRQLKTSLYSFEAHDQEIKSFDVDHHLGRLLLVSGQN